MASARGFGVGVGRVAGKSAAYAVKGLGVAFESLGEVGSGVLEGADSGYTETAASLDARIEARKVKLLELQQKARAAKEAVQVAAPMVAA